MFRRWTEARFPILILELMPNSCLMSALTCCQSILLLAIMLDTPLTIAGMSQADRSSNAQGRSIMRIDLTVYSSASVAAGILDIVWGEFEPAHQPFRPGATTPPVSR